MLRGKKVRTRGYVVKGINVYRQQQYYAILTFPIQSPYEMRVSPVPRNYCADEAIRTVSNNLASQSLTGSSQSLADVLESGHGPIFHEFFDLESELEEA